MFNFLFIYLYLFIEITAAKSSVDFQVDDDLEVGNDGIFFMDFNDWLKYYTHLFCCMTFPDNYRGWRITGEWTTENSGGNNSCLTWKLNPKYQVDIIKDNTTVFIQCIYIYIYNLNISLFSFFFLSFFF